MLHHLVLKNKGDSQVKFFGYIKTWLIISYDIQYILKNYGHSLGFVVICCSLLILPLKIIQGYFARHDCPSTSEEPQKDMDKEISNYTPRTTKLLGGYTGFTPSVRPSVCPSVRPSVPHAVSALYHLQIWMDSFHIRHKWSLPWEGVSCTMTFDLDLYLQGHLALT